MALKRKICILTGTRAEYGLLRCLMRAVRAHPRLELQTAVTGMHLLEEFGHTEKWIRSDGFDVSVRIPMYANADETRRGLPSSLARLTATFGRWLLENRADFVVVLGDRIEALGGALAALTAGAPLAHLHGGELAAGDMDDRIRFAISALATLHFVSTIDARDRLIRAGEPRDRITVVGAMAMDEIVEFRKTFSADRRMEFRRQLGLPLDRPVAVVLHHPSGFGADREYRYMKFLLAAVKKLDGVVIGPNNDPGHTGIRRAIREFLAPQASNPSRSWVGFENLSRPRFLSTLSAADVLVGNSSSGILEANPLGTPVVNVGPRQLGRRRNGSAVFDCDYAQNSVRIAVEKALRFPQTHRICGSRAFGTGQAAATIARALSEVKINRDLMVKART